LDATSAQTDTNKPVTGDIGKITIGVKGHASEIPISGRCAEVWGKNVHAPIWALFVTVIRVSGNEKTGVRCRTIADQQLVRVCGASSHTIPQSIGTSSLPIVRSGRQGLVHTSLKVGLVSSLMINEDNFCKLKGTTIIALSVMRPCMGYLSIISVRFKIYVCTITECFAPVSQRSRVPLPFKA